MWSYILMSLVWIGQAYAKLPCDYLSMVNNNVQVQKGTIICLGPCPSVTKTAGNIYIAPGQLLYFNTFILRTTANSFTIANTKDDEPILTCFSDSAQCFAGTVPAKYPDSNFPPGLYLTGKAGGEQVSVFDPWLTLSTLRLNEVTTLSQVELPMTAAKYSINGWRLVIKNNEQTINYAYTFTNHGQLIVGDIDAGTIYSSPDATVLANGPVYVQQGFRQCAVPLPRPNQKTMLLIYVPFGANVSFCDLSTAKNSFAYNVEMDKCHVSPVLTPFEKSFFKVAQNGLSFCNDAKCMQCAEAKTVQNPCQRGWNGVILPPAVF